jgi:hypothetical protein
LAAVAADVILVAVETTEVTLDTDVLDGVSESFLELGIELLPLVIG